MIDNPMPEKQHGWYSTNPMFRNLTQEEVDSFTEYAKNNSPGDKDPTILHPVCVIEWERQGYKWRLVKE